MNMREIRQKSNIRQEELAKRVGVSQAMISGIENCTRRGSYSTLEAIAAELQCTLEDLTGEPPVIVQLIRNCKRLSLPQIATLNAVALHMAKPDTLGETNG